MLPTLIVLSAMGLLVLMIACANIAGLVLVRGVSRRGEIAVRLALGATRRADRPPADCRESGARRARRRPRRAARAAQAIPLLVGYAERLAAPQRVFFNIGVDSLVIGFAALVACGSALVFGFVPALQSSRVDLVSVINEDASPRGAARGRLRAGLVVAQVAVSLLLLVGAGLATRSRRGGAARRSRLRRRASVTAIDVDVKQNGYDEARGRVFYRQLLDAARADPGIESATLAAYTPLAFLDTPAQRVAIEGYEPRRGEDLAFMSNTVGPDYFRTLRIPIVAGRAFEDRDDETAAPVAIVNNTLAQRFWGGAANAIGKRIRVGDGDWRTVIGVAADVKYSRINEVAAPLLLPAVPAVVPVEHDPAHARAGARSTCWWTRRARMSRRSTPICRFCRARPLAENIRGALHLLRPDGDDAVHLRRGRHGAGRAWAPTDWCRTPSSRARTRSASAWRSARPASSVVRGFLGRGLRLGAIGAALGIVAALGVSRLLGSVLFGVSATDPPSFARALAIVLAA